MALVQDFLRQHGLEELKRQHMIHAGFHPTFPLVVLNYNNMSSDRYHPLIIQCRGIVLEKDSWEMHARGMDRFFENTELNFPAWASVKEDGTLIHAFWYRDQWVISTRYNFGEDFLPRDRTRTYSDLFFSLVSLGGCDRSLTYCFEMCSLTNKVIRPYPNPVCYLLMAFRNGVEVEVEGFVRPEKHRVNSMKEAQNLLTRYVREDPLFEGLVLSNEGRMKLKSDYYKTMHCFKYRGWVTATPARLQPLLPHLDILREFLREHRPDDLPEFERRIDFCIRGERYPYPDPTHPSEYCSLRKMSGRTGGIATRVPFEDESGWRVFCFCGQEMKLTFIRSDLLRYKTCHCGKVCGVHKYSFGTQIWICPCGLTHEAIEDRPSGIPASEQCKNLRLHCHQLLKSFRTKDQAYARLASMMNLPRDQCHMALFEIQDCEKAILMMQR
jgi:hypothetical protein